MAKIMNGAGNETEFGGQIKQDPWKNRKGAKGAWIAITFIVAALVVTVAIIQGASHRSASKVAELPDSRKGATNAAPLPAELSVSFRGVAKEVKPAVVYVNVVERA